MTDARLTKAFVNAAAGEDGDARLTKQSVNVPILRNDVAYAAATKIWLSAVASRDQMLIVDAGSYALTGSDVTLEYTPGGGTGNGPAAIPMRPFPILRDDQVPNVQTRVIANRAIAGKLNVNGQLTLNPNTGTTTLSDALLTSTSVLTVTPRTANAAAARSTLYFDAPINGSVVLNHATNSQSDRTFLFSIIG